MNVYSRLADLSWVKQKLLLNWPPLLSRQWCYFYCLKDSEDKTQCFWSHVGCREPYQTQQETTSHFQSFPTSYFCASYDFPTTKVISNLLCVWSSLANCLAMQFRRAARCGPLVHAVSSFLVLLFFAGNPSNNNDLIAGISTAIQLVFVGISWPLFADYWRSKRLLIGRGAVCQTIWYIA